MSDQYTVLVVYNGGDDEARLTYDKQTMRGDRERTPEEVMDMAEEEVRERYGPQPDIKEVSII